MSGYELVGGAEPPAEADTAEELEWCRKLNTSTHPEWRSRYLHYQRLKAHTHRATATLLMAEALYQEQLATTGRTLRNIIATLRSIARISSPGKLGMFLRGAQKYEGPAELLPDAQDADIRGALRRLFERLSALESFCALNAQGFARLAPRATGGPAGRLARDVRDKCAGYAFAAHEELTAMVELAQAVYAEAFCDGLRAAAMAELAAGAAAHGRAGRSAWAVFRLGVFVCLLALLGSLALAWFLKTPRAKLVDGESVFILFRTLGLAILLVWMWGIDLAVWTWHRINYVYVFEYDSRTHKSNWVRIVEVASVFTLVWLAGVALYLLGCAPPAWLWFLGRVYPPLWPLTLGGCAFLVLLVYQITHAPLPLCPSAPPVKFSLVRTVGRIVLSPLTPVRFRESFMADQLVSLAVVVYDLEFSVCYYTADVWRSPTGTQCLRANSYTQPLIAGIPALWRLLQCLRQAVLNGDRMQFLNAGTPAAR
eukprot:m51a1_g4686 hypothetical protein (482) ;mRNA; r:180431-182731